MAAASESTNKSVVEHRGENNVMNSMILVAEPSGERKITSTIHRMLEDYDELGDKDTALRHYRDLFYTFLCNSCAPLWDGEEHEDTVHLDDMSDDAKLVLSYYAPYLTLLGEKPMGVSHTEVRKVKIMLGFSDLFDRTEEDRDALSKAYRDFTRRQREMMEVIERAAQQAQEHILANFIFGEGRMVAYRRIVKFIRDELNKSPIIKAEFSKTELEEFLIPAVAHRTFILSYE